MPLEVISAAFVRRATCPSGKRKVDYFDSRQRGFLLEVRSSGGKTYYQRYRDRHGKERQLKIGPADALSFQQASRKGREILSQALLGVDPCERKAELKSVPTFRDFASDRYIPFATSTKRSWKTDETILRLHILPRLGKNFLDEVTAEAVSDLIQTMRQAGYASGTTNRALIVIRYMYNLAKKWNVSGSNFNPTDGLSVAPDVCRDRFLTEGEARRLLSALDVDENQVAAKAITLLMLTGARRNEITHAEWTFVNWEKRTLLVPRAKSGKARIITLSAAAVDLLRSIPIEVGNRYIFPSPATGQPCPSLHFPWLRIRRRADLLDIRLHDLRHSFASFLVNQGVSLYVVQGLLGHSQPRMTQRYAHLAQNTLSQAAELLPQLMNAPRTGGLLN